MGLRYERLGECYLLITLLLRCISAFGSETSGATCKNLPIYLLFQGNPLVGRSSEEYSRLLTHFSFSSWCFCLGCDPSISPPPPSTHTSLPDSFLMGDANPKKHLGRHFWAGGQDNFFYSRIPHPTPQICKQAPPPQ